MSLKQFFGDVLDGNYQHAWERAKDFIHSIPDSVSKFAAKFGKQEY